MKMRFIFLVTCCLTHFVYAQVKPLNLQDLAKQNKNQICNFSLPFTQSNLKAIESEGLTIKYLNKNWIFFRSSVQKVDALLQSKAIQNLYFEFSNPQALADSALFKHKINLVHQGLQGIDTSYTGKNVLIGIIDQGIDFNHPDFKKANGKTRVLRYWDHTISNASPPQPYGYGVLWDSLDINQGLCTSLETGTAHGTTVSGMAVGNGLANSKNKGVAPNADIVVVETNFNLPNWTLSIADACDYIFKVADSLGKTAVINLSVGSYLGSHDGEDPAADYISSLVSAQNGRIVVCAAGNAGNQGKFHVTGNVNADTSFFWNIRNPGVGLAGPNKILFDLWSDTLQANYNFAFGADSPGPNFHFSGNSDFHNALSNINTSPLYDTIYNSNGQRLACIESYREIVGANFHMQVLFNQIDSLNYLYRFMTYGQGKYDVWGGAWQQLSDFISVIPSVSQYPPIQFYQAPDSLQSIVSSWNCSEQVISVGNFRNRKGYIDKNNTYYLSSSTTPVGKLSENSSKGPTRHGVIKPDIAASGDLSLTAGPLWYLSNPANNSSIDQGAFHVRNGGTSMAAPVISGIAGLYLEKCKLANWQSFKQDLIATAAADNYTGTLPNFGYGYGKADAHALLLSKNAAITFTGPAGICLGSTATIGFTTNAMINSILWSNGAQSPTINTAISGTYQVKITDMQGCVTRSPLHVLNLYPLPFVDAGNNYITCPGIPITLTGSGTATQYIWEGNIQNNQAFTPTGSAVYHVTGINQYNCQAIDSITVNLFGSIAMDYTETNINIPSNSNPFNLTLGAPLGGVYSGIGVIGTSFHPSLAGLGTHTIYYTVIDANGCSQSDSSLITVYSGLGLEEESIAWNLFPNPSSDAVTIECPEQLFGEILQIYDTQGRLITSQKISDYQTGITCSSWSSGNYLIKIGAKVKRLIIE